MALFSGLTPGGKTFGSVIVSASLLWSPLGPQKSLPRRLQFFGGKCTERPVVSSCHDKGLKQRFCDFFVKKTKELGLILVVKGNGSENAEIKAENKQLASQKVYLRYLCESLWRNV